MKIKKGDTVQVISGDDKGMTGTVRRVIVARVPVRRHKRRGKLHAEPDLNRCRVLISGVQSMSVELVDQAGNVSNEVDEKLGNPIAIHVTLEMIPEGLFTRLFSLTGGIVHEEQQQTS